MECHSISSGEREGGLSWVKNSKEAREDGYVVFDVPPEYMAQIEASDGSTLDVFLAEKPDAIITKGTARKIAEYAITGHAPLYPPRDIDTLDEVEGVDVSTPEGLLAYFGSCNTTANQGLLHERRVIVSSAAVLALYNRQYVPTNQELEGDAALSVALKCALFAAEDKAAGRECSVDGAFMARAIPSRYVTDEYWKCLGKACGRDMQPVMDEGRSVAYEFVTMVEDFASQEPQHMI